MDSLSRRTQEGLRKASPCWLSRAPNQAWELTSEPEAEPCVEVPALSWAFAVESVEDPPPEPWEVAPPPPDDPDPEPKGFPEELTTGQCD